MDEDQLSLEQRFLLQRIRLDASTMEHEPLVTALCDAWEARFRLKQIFASMSREAGFSFVVEERLPWRRPESDADYERVFGYIPSAQEREAFLKYQEETVTMELDMEAIVLTPDEDD